MGNQQIKKIKSKSFPAIPNSTVESMMGVDRWKSMINEVRREYGTKKVTMDFTAEGPKVRLTDAYGKLLGTVACVEAWAIKQRKKRKKK